jgi:glycosyltransferase involved in cell wall biosynthesis
VFSVIIPTRDRPHYLRSAISSVLRQSQAPEEIIIVNDGDPIATAFGDRRVRVLNNGRRGPVAGRQLGVESAKGEAIAFLDDDDEWHDPSHLALASEALQQGASFTFSDGTLVFDQAGIPDVPFQYAADAASLESDNTILISAVCYRRDLHETLGSFDMALPYYWDWDWYLRVARGGHDLHHVAVPTVTIRVHTGNMSGDTSADARQTNLEALARKHAIPLPRLKNHLSLAQERQV